jgi:hypothetical protein
MTRLHRKEILRFRCREKKMHSRILGFVRSEALRIRVWKVPRKISEARIVPLAGNPQEIHTSSVYLRSSGSTHEEKQRLSNDFDERHGRCPRLARWPEPYVMCNATSTAATKADHRRRIYWLPNRIESFSLKAY